jgi:hypothetical protein
LTSATTKSQNCLASKIRRYGFPNAWFFARQLRRTLRNSCLTIHQTTDK